MSITTPAPVLYGAARFSFWDWWIDRKTRWVRDDVRQLDEGIFRALAAGTGLPPIHQRSTFPFHNVKDGVKYPATLLIHGINDPRVAPWMSLKMAARLQAATASDKPVLMRIDYAGGHGIGSTKSQRQEQVADMWSFMLWQFGDAAFQPAAR